MSIGLIRPALGHRPLPWDVRPDRVGTAWQNYWPSLMCAFPCWERAGAPQDVATRLRLSVSAPAWGSGLASGNVVSGKVYQTRSASGSIPDNTRYQMAKYGVTVMVLFYRPSTGVATGNYSRLLGKNAAGPQFQSWALVQRSTDQTQYLFAVSTTTADNQVQQLTGTIPNNAWHWLVGRWATGGEVNIESFSLAGVIEQSTNPSPPTPGGSLRYDSTALAFGNYDADYGAAYAFSRRLTTSEVRQIIADPWGLVRPASAAAGLYGTTGSGSGASTARSFVAGLLG